MNFPVVVADCPSLSFAFLVDILTIRSMLDSRKKAFFSIATAQNVSPLLATLYIFLIYICNFFSEEETFQTVHIIRMQV